MLDCINCDHLLQWNTKFSKPLRGTGQITFKSQVQQDEGKFLQIWKKYISKFFVSRDQNMAINNHKTQKIEDSKNQDSTVNSVVAKCLEATCNRPVSNRGQYFFSLNAVNRNQNIFKTADLKAWIQTFKPLAPLRIHLAFMVVTAEWEKYLEEITINV